MDFLIKDALIKSPESFWHNQKADILVSEGIIKTIGINIQPLKKSTKVISGNQLYCCIGLCDIGTTSGEPGYEHRETVETLAKCAFAGGYTHLVVFPNTKPVIQTKGDIEYLKAQAKKAGINVTAVGALSKDSKGENISEFIDMHQAGVISFSDGIQPVKSSGLLMRALQYASQFDGIVINHPDDQSLSHHGQMHEGTVSTTLGLSGIPDIAELSMIQRDILIQKYTGTKLIEHAISAAISVEAIRTAKKSLSKVFSTVAYLNLVADHTALEGFDSNLKLSPVLRQGEDRKALLKGLKDGTIDAIVTNHVPLEEELKRVEFPYATPGATGLQTCLLSCLDLVDKNISLDTILEKLTSAPRNLLNIAVPIIEENQPAEICIFDLDTPFIFTETENLSLSKNNPFFGTTFKSRIVATMNGGTIYLAV
ncbi:MAG: amidohydrolase family protein [Saprospiraceae bacterium]|nr:amidohydrolase family protein [Saprospiraceae bacterium]